MHFVIIGTTMDLIDGLLSAPLDRENLAALAALEFGHFGTIIAAIFRPEGQENKAQASARLQPG
jgi:hypothetical protein